jgi:hypothetical protein
MSKRSVIFCAAGIAACAAAYIFSRLEFEHECQIDFLYEDRLVWNAQTRNDEVARGADEHNRNAVLESLLHDFAKESRVKRMANAKSEREKSDEEARVAQLSQRMDNCERQIALYREMDVRTNTMFKIMIPAGVATNIVTRRIAQRLREQREGLSPWR